MACVSLATIMWIVDVHGLKRWTKPFVIYGMNPMVAFVGSGRGGADDLFGASVTYQGKSVLAGGRDLSGRASRRGCRR